MLDLAFFQIYFKKLNLNFNKNSALRNFVKLLSRSFLAFVLYIFLHRYKICIRIVKHKFNWIVERLNNDTQLTTTHFPTNEYFNHCQNCIWNFWIGSCFTWCNNEFFSINFKDADIESTAPAFSLETPPKEPNCRFINSQIYEEQLINLNINRSKDPTTHKAFQLVISPKPFKTATYNFF